MSIHEKAQIELTKVAREAFTDPSWEMPEGWMDTSIPGYGMSPKKYIDRDGEAAIKSLSNHIRGIAMGVYA